MSSCRAIVVFCHGLLGRREDFATWADILVEKGEAYEHPIDIYSFQWDGKAFDGIAAYGQSIKEKMEVILQSSLNRHEQVRLSVIGHSFGGLAARYAMGGLFEFFVGNRSNIVLCTFMTLATPHLGIAHTSIWKKPISYLVSKCLGRAGKELVLKDDQTIIQTMSQPRSSFFRALSLFRYPTLVGNTAHDFHVPYSSAMLTSHNPFEASVSIFECLQSKIHHHSGFGNFFVATPTTSSSSIEKEIEYDDQLLQDMNNNIPWRRLAVEFNSMLAHVYLIKEKKWLQELSVLVLEDLFEE